jgi:hypothetical protein
LSFPGSAEAGPENLPEGFDLAALLNALVATLLGLKLAAAKGLTVVLTAVQAEQWILEASRGATEGLRRIAWAIHVAIHRPGDKLGPVKCVWWLNGILRHWRAGDGAPPDGWPPFLRPPADPPPPLKVAAADDQAKPSDRAELVAMIAETEALPQTPANQAILGFYRAELARVEAGPDPGGTKP